MKSSKILGHPRSIIRSRPTRTSRPTILLVRIVSLIYFISWKIKSQRQKCNHYRYFNSWSIVNVYYCYLQEWSIKNNYIYIYFKHQRILIKTFSIPNERIFLSSIALKWSKIKCKNSGDQEKFADKKRKKSVSDKWSEQYIRLITRFDV